MIIPILLLVGMMGITRADASLNNIQATQKSSSVNDFEGNVYYYDITDRADYQLSQEQLDAPTDDLIDAILEYPYLVDLFCGNSINDTYQRLRDNFNGLQELEKRADAASALLSRSSNTAISDMDDDLSAVYLQIILSVPSYYEKLTANEVAAYQQMAGSNASVASITATQAADYLAENVSAYSNKPVVFTLNGFSYVRSDTDGTTTSGTIVPFYTALSDYTSSEQVDVAENTGAVYEIDVLGYATSMYNCHSYAWYWKSTYNKAWIMDISPYVNDAHCESLSSDDVNVGAIAVYLDEDDQPLHSAVVTHIDSDVIICESKWGADGLFEHNIANVPISYSYNGTSVKVVFYEYTRYHTYTAVASNAALHTKTCNICGWSVDEAHIENVKTGKCSICGIVGPFLTIAPLMQESPTNIIERSS